MLSRQIAQLVPTFSGIAICLMSKPLLLLDIYGVILPLAGQANASIAGIDVCLPVGMSKKDRTFELG